MICSTAKCVERGWITAQLDPVLIQFFLQCSKQRFFDLFVYDNRLTGIADTDTLSLCIVDDPDSHVEVGAFINVDMAVSGTSLNDRDRAVFYDSLDQPGASARNQHIDILSQLHKTGCSLPVCRFDQLDRIFTDTAVFQCFL